MQTNAKVIYTLILALVLAVSACFVTKPVVYATLSDFVVKNQAKVYQSPCKNFLEYAPDNENLNWYNPYYIKVNFHFIDHPENNINFNEAEGRQYVKDLIHHANKHFNNNKKMHLPVGNNTAVLPINLQYVLTPDPSVTGDDGIHFHKDSVLWYINKKDKRGIYGLYSDALYNKYGVQKEEVLNVFMLEHHPDSIASSTYKVASNGIGKPYYTKVTNSYFNYKETKTGKTSKGSWFAAPLLNHEIGHTFGLLHSWTRNDGCEDTPPNDNCWNNNGSPPCDVDVISNNLMDYNAYCNALTPCQIAKMHYKISKNNSSQRKLVRADWCNYQADKAIFIKDGEQIEWTSAMFVYGDIIIQDGGQLTLHCLTAMPAGSTIKIESGGSLVLNNGKLYNACNEKWNGIELVKTINKQKGNVILIGDASIENTKYNDDFSSIKQFQQQQ